MKLWKIFSASLLIACLLNTALPIAVFAKENPFLDNNLFPSFLTIEKTTAKSQIISDDSDKVQLKQFTVILDGQPTTIQYTKIPFDTLWNADVCIAQAAIGQSEELLSMSDRTGAALAINGSAYQNFDLTKLADPYGTIISKNKIIHADTTELLSLIIGTDGSFVTDNLTLELKGSIEQDAFTFNAINHTPSQTGETITFFDKSRGKSVGFRYGTNYIVQNNIITAIQINTDSLIPDNGFVVNIIGNEKLQQNFQINQTVHYSFSCQNHNLETIQAALAIENLLISDSEIITQNDTLANTTPLTRTAIGITDSDDIVALSGVRATVSQLADIMHALNCKTAVALNGGNAAGLVIGGEYIAEPTLNISNALIFKISE